MQTSTVYCAVVGLALLAASPVSAQGDPASGQTLFSQKCAQCHAVTPDLAHGLLGPNLVGIAGRAAATAPGWDYSAAFKESKLVWTDENLHKWLTDPPALVPKTEMALKVPSRLEREDLIAYLKTLKAK